MRLDEWNTALLREIVQKGHSTEGLYLYVDRDLLGRLSGLEPAQALKDFSAAFQAASGTSRPFEKGALTAQKWRRSGLQGPPPIVAHLAMTVLAVTEEPVGDPQGVYRQQNELLGLPADASAPRGYSEDVPLLWEVWNEWLAGPGSRYGQPTAKTYSRWKYQGWARTQGLVRYSDRLRVDRFFGMMGLAQARKPDVEFFRLWLQYRGAYGADLLRKLNDEAACSVMQEVLEHEGRRWLREGPRPSQAGSTIQGFLHFHEWSETFGGVVEVLPKWYGECLAVGPEDTYVPDEQDRFVVLTPGTPAAQLLDHGVTQPLESSTSVRWGGDDVYVMYDEPLVNGRLQCRTLGSAPNYHLLVHSRLLDEVTAALADLGVAAEALAAGVEGWHWLENVTLDRDSDTLQLLGLGALAPSAESIPALQGGLRIRPNTYLCGGEPDLTLPAGWAEPLLLDGKLLRAALDVRLLALKEEVLAPGRHKIVTGDVEIPFATVSHMREAAASGDLGRPGQPMEGGYLFSDAVRSPKSPVALMGGTIRGLAAPCSIRAWKSPTSEALVLTDSGEVREIWPQTSPWLRRIQLIPTSVDVLEAVRTMSPPPAFFISLPSRGPRRGVEIPAGTSLLPGKVPSAGQPDRIPDLLRSQAEWASGSRQQRFLRLRPLMTGGPHRFGGSQPPPQRPVSLRGDVLSGPVAENPYDDVLAWIAEHEQCRVSNMRFAEAWAWLCHRHGLPSLASQWRLALYSEQARPRRAGLRPPAGGGHPARPGVSTDSERSGSPHWSTPF